MPLALAFSVGSVNSQPCALGNSGVKLNYSVVDGSNCKINIDLYFDMVHNPGGKWFWVHIWPAASYSDWNYGTPPTLANSGLNGSIATFGVEHHGSNLLIQTSYPPDPSAPGFQSNGLNVVVSPGTMSGSDRYTVKNLMLTAPGSCDIPQSYMVDVWESQSAQSQVVHCFVKGMNFFANDPTVNGILYCDVPRKYSFSLKTISNTTMSVNYKVFIDDGNGVFNASGDNILVNSGTEILSSGNLFRYQSPMLGYLPYSGQKPWSDRDLWVEITTASIPNAIYAQLTNSCIPLPVQISTINAQRNGENVRLQWTTVTEMNNRGFYIERNDDSYHWNTIAFVPTQAIAGNSNTLLSYLYSDNNRNNDVSTYRLRQVDFDGKLTYSSVVSVDGLKSKDELVFYPNPCGDDQLMIRLDANASFKIELYNQDGRITRQWSNLQSGSYDLKGLDAGVYILKVTNKNTGDIRTGKLILVH